MDPKHIVDRVRLPISLSVLAISKAGRVHSLFGPFSETRISVP